MNVDPQHEEPEATWASLFTWNSTRMRPILLGLGLAGLLFFGWIWFTRSDSETLRRARNAWGTLNHRQVRAARVRQTKQIAASPELLRAGFAASVITKQGASTSERWRAVDFPAPPDSGADYLTDRGCFFWPIDEGGEPFALVEGDTGRTPGPGEVYCRASSTGGASPGKALMMSLPRGWMDASFGTDPPGTVNELAAGIPRKFQRIPWTPCTVAASEGLFSQNVTIFSNLLMDLERVSRPPTDFGDVQRAAGVALVRETWESLRDHGFFFTAVRVGPSRSPMLFLEKQGRPILPGTQGVQFMMPPVSSFDWSTPLDDPSITWISRDDIPIYLEDGSGPFRLSTLPD